ncbi:FbpB family small basic protein [Salisediminibacterium beveridgei]|nr:FbpB family small basic protein [Salisediminibacterium beveridgei]
MRKRIQKSFEELVQENVQEIMSSETAMYEIDEKIDERYETADPE